MENYRSKRLPLGRPAKPLRSAAAPSCLFDNPAARGYTEGGEIFPVFDGNDNAKKGLKAVFRRTARFVFIGENHDEKSAD